MVMINTFILTALFLLVSAIPGQAEQKGLPNDGKIILERLSADENRGYGYRLQYYVAAPIEAVWRFKTDFDSEILLTNEELIAHRIVKFAGSSVITENRYAAAPSLNFRWRTTLLPDQHRLEFDLLNPEDCRHDFHYGSIQLSPAGRHTKITQIAFFNFRGASFWVKYPWYGGMRSTLAKVAKWEQDMAPRYKYEYLAAVK